MLSIAPQDLQPQPYYLPFRSLPQRQPELPFTSFVSMGSPPTSPVSTRTAQDASVAQALEIARESPDGASDPTISKILEAALSQLWSKVQAQPDSYVMSCDEFAVFNFFQHRFTGNKTAVSARKRYWDNYQA